MRAALQDAAGRSLGPGADPSEGDTLVDERLGNVQVISAHALCRLRVGHGRGHDLVDRLGSGLRGELEGDKGVLDVHAADEVDDATNLCGAHADVTRDGVRAVAIAQEGLATTAVAVLVAHS